MRTFYLIVVALAIFLFNLSSVYSQDAPATNSLANLTESCTERIVCHCDRTTEVATCRHQYVSATGASCLGLVPSNNATILHDCACWDDDVDDNAPETKDTDNTSDADAVAANAATGNCHVHRHHALNKWCTCAAPKCYPKVSYECDVTTGHGVPTVLWHFLNGTECQGVQNFEGIHKFLPVSPPCDCCGGKCHLNGSLAECDLCTGNETCTAVNSYSCDVDDSTGNGTGQFGITGYVNGRGGECCEPHVHPLVIAQPDFIEVLDCKCTNNTNCAFGNGVGLHECACSHSCPESNHVSEGHCCPNFSNWSPFANTCCPRLGLNGLKPVPCPLDTKLNSAQLCQCYPSDNVTCNTTTVDGEDSTTCQCDSPLVDDGFGKCVPSTVGGFNGTTGGVNPDWPQTQCPTIIDKYDCELYHTFNQDVGKCCLSNTGVVGPTNTTCTNETVSECSYCKCPPGLERVMGTCCNATLSTLPGTNSTLPGTNSTLPGNATMYGNCTAVVQKHYCNNWFEDGDADDQQYHFSVAYGRCCPNRPRYAHTVPYCTNVTASDCTPCKCPAHTVHHGGVCCNGTVPHSILLDPRGDNHYHEVRHHSVHRRHHDDLSHEIGEYIDNVEDAVEEAVEDVEDEASEVYAAAKHYVKHAEHKAERAIKHAPRYLKHVEHKAAKVLDAVEDEIEEEASELSHDAKHALKHAKHTLKRAGSDLEDTLEAASEEASELSHDAKHALKHAKHSLKRLGSEVSEEAEEVEHGLRSYLKSAAHGGKKLLKRAKSYAGYVAEEAEEVAEQAAEEAVEETKEVLHYASKAAKYAKDTLKYGYDSLSYYLGAGESDSDDDDDDSLTDDDLIALEFIIDAGIQDSESSSPQDIDDVDSQASPTYRRYSDADERDL
jgi:ElaB/YqjD/DUF883 family membrane-anchored ribosome-binding protein